MLKIPKDKKPNYPLIEVNILYPNSFQELRKSQNIPLELFIPTIAGSESWITSGGKSGSPFMRSHNDLVVVKKIQEREFSALRKLLPKYFLHLAEGSLLTPIYGAF